MYNDNGDYLGWVTGNDVWREDGSYLGEIIDENYILRNDNKIESIPKIPKIPPIPPIPPIASIDRIGRIDRIGWSDALNEYR